MKHVKVADVVAGIPPCRAYLWREIDSQGFSVPPSKSMASGRHVTEMEA